MQTFQMDNQKTNTRTNLQKEMHEKQLENSIILPIRALKFKYQPQKGSQQFRFLKIKNSPASP